MTAITRITVHTAVTTTGLDALACKGTLGLGGTEMRKFPDDWDEGEWGEEGLEEDEEVVGFEEWRVGASEELRIKFYKSGMRCKRGFILKLHDAIDNIPDAGRLTPPPLPQKTW